MDLKTRRGFTHVELLAVIGIIGFLSALLLPAILRSKARVKDVRCLSQLRPIGVASIIFAGDAGNLPVATMPNSNRFLSPLQPILPVVANAKIFICPADTERMPSLDLNSLNRSNTSYFVGYSANLPSAS
jgi:type II secretory pathway pseudopilin PulG